MEKSIWDKYYKDSHGNKLSVWGHSATVWIEKQLDNLKKNDIKTILDAGCGDGRNTLALAKEGFEVTAIDSSCEAILLAKKNTANFSNINYVCKRLEDISYNAEFDAILCDYVMTHLKNIELIVSHFCDALKPKGFFIGEVFSTDDPSYIKCQNNNFYEEDGIYHSFYTKKDMEMLFSKFKILKLEQLEHEDPPHGNLFERNTKHIHNSFFILAQK